MPLQNYLELTMNQDMIDSILDAIRFLSDKTGLRGNIELRRGQVNFYCNATREDRNRFAKGLNLYFHDTGLWDLNAIVPSAKLVIDISLSTKKRALVDFEKRIGPLDFRNVLYISDSLQTDGSDIILLKQMPEVMAFHVGPADTAVCEGVVFFGGGPEGTKKILAHVSKLGHHYLVPLALTGNTAANSIGG